MNTYELMYILPSSLTEEEAPKKATTINDLLAKHQVTIVQDIDLGKKKLAYPIQKDRYGYYRLVEFTAEPAVLGDLDTTLRLSRELLRHLITVKPKKSDAQIAKERALREKLAAKRQRELETGDQTKSVSEQPAISAEDLDKKLEKILDEEPTV